MLLSGITTTLSSLVASNVAPLMRSESNRRRRTEEERSSVNGVAVKLPLVFLSTESSSTKRLYRSSTMGPTKSQNCKTIRNKALENSP